MKNELQLSMKKIRNQLKVHTLTEDERRLLREKLDYLKNKHKEEKEILVKNI